MIIGGGRKGEKLEKVIKFNYIFAINYLPSRKGEKFYWIAPFFDFPHSTFHLNYLINSSARSARR